MEKVRVRIIRSTVAGGEPVDEGRVVDVSADDARILFAMNKAEPAIMSEPKVDNPDPDSGDPDPDKENPDPDSGDPDPDNENPDPDSKSGMSTRTAGGLIAGKKDKK